MVLPPCRDVRAVRGGVLPKLLLHVDEGLVTLARWPADPREVVPVLRKPALRPSLALADVTICARASHEPLDQERVVAVLLVVEEEENE